MKLIFKKIIFFIINLFIYFIPSFIFPTDKTFYNSLKGNFVPSFVFIIVWIIIFIINSFINTYYYFNKETLPKKELRVFYIIVIINYLFVFLFPLGFFVLKDLFLGYIFTLLTATTTIIMAMQSLLLNKKLTLLYLPYIIWTIFASIYSILLYLKN